MSRNKRGYYCEMQQISKYSGCLFAGVEMNLHGTNVHQQYKYEKNI